MRTTHATLVPLVQQVLLSRGAESRVHGNEIVLGACCGLECVCGGGLQSAGRGAVHVAGVQRAELIAHGVQLAHNLISQARGGLILVATAVDGTAKCAAGGSADTALQVRRTAAVA